MKKLLWIFIFIMLVALVRVFFFGLSEWLKPNRDEEAGRFIDTTMKLCQVESTRTRQVVCFKKAMVPVVQRIGVDALGEAIGRYYWRLSSATCHDVTHALGQVGAQVLGPRSALLGCTNICGAGCFHGVLEGYLASGGSLESAIGTLCTVKGSEFDRVRWACFHGIGHGIAGLVSSLGPAFKLCDGITEDENRRHCGRGVIMEMLQSSSFNHELLPIDKPLVTLCLEFEGVYRDVCFENVGITAYFRGFGFKESVAACNGVPETMYRRCVTLFGDVLYHEQKGEVSSIVADCKQTGRITWCLSGAIQEDVLSDPKAVKSFQFCQAFPQASVLACYSYLGERIQSIHGKEIQTRLCTPLSDEGRAYCMGEKSVDL